MVQVRKITEEEIVEIGIRNWPVWEKEVSHFPASYEEEEWCYFLEGEVVIETESGKFTIYPGDFVIFRKALSCTWDIRKPVKKHYNFL